MNEAVSQFDKMAAEWDSNPVRVALAEAVAESIRRAVPLRTDMQALDFGAGTGLLTFAILPHVATVTAVDASGQMLRVLERKVAERGVDTVETMQADIAHTPLPESKFDLIVSSMALHHIKDVDLGLSRLRDCLRPGGWIALADLDAEDGSFHPDTTGVYHHGFDRDGFRLRMVETGFTDVLTSDAHRIEKNNRQYGVFLTVGKRV